MSLRMDVLKYRGNDVTEPASAVFNQDGGTVGRSGDNRLVLPDESVSRKHAQISYKNGFYYLTDQSTNGTLIMNSDLLVHDAKVELADGDLLCMGDYELSVNIAEEDHTATSFPVSPDHGISSQFESEDDLIKEPRPGAARPAAPIPPAVQKQAAGTAWTDNIDDFFEDIDDFFKETGEEEKSAPVLEPVVGHADVTSRKPQVSNLIDTLPDLRIVERSEDIQEVQPSLELPRDIQEVRPSLEPGKDIQEVQPSLCAADPLKETGQVTREACRELFNLFLEGARIEDPNFVNNAEIPELMASLGAVFRELVNGLWTVLRGRTELKAEIRLAMTMVRPTGNNPLKLSPRIEDVLKSLLKREHPSFLQPIDAVRDGFEDVMNHQLAMNAGIQASLLEALDQFDPQRFAEKNKDRSVLQTKGKYWKDYCAAYNELKERALEGIFGKAFVRAYEEQQEKLHSKHKKS